MLKVANSVINASRITGVLPVANGGTNASTASITSFNNITGFTASGTTGTTSTNLVFATTPTLVGDVTLSTGNLVIGTSGKGIDFSADPSAPGMTSELLDDYEEGTWTPVDTSGASLTFTGVGCRYTKIGNQVTLSGTFTYPSTASAAGTSIGSLPFSTSGTEVTMALLDNAGVGANQIYLANTNFSIRAAGTETDRTNTQFSLKKIQFFASYQTAS